MEGEAPAEPRGTLKELDPHPLTPFFPEGSKGGDEERYIPRNTLPKGLPGGRIADF